MYIYNKPHVDPDDAETGTTNNTEQASSSSHLHQLNSPPSPSTFPRRPSNISSTAKGAISNRPSKSRRHSLSFSLPPLFFQPPNSSSASLVPSTAEGKPIPLDDSTAAHRTSALRELNSNYPSPVNRHRHRYAKSSGAQSSTYSQPVIVRTYSGPSPSQASYSAHSYHHRPPSATRGGGSRRIPLPLPARAHSYLSGGRPAKPTISGAGSLGTVGGAPPSAGKHGQHVANMPRAHAKKSKLPWQWQLGSAQPQQGQQGQQGHDEAKLPPLEAFSFKSFMADFQAEDGGAGGSIGADLDRIAEICARSRYSLSNQYEVHVAPHGSGSAFMSPGVSSSAAAAGGRRKGNNGTHAPMGMGGPTLQAINSDDDDNNGNGNAGGRSHRKRRSGARRRSVAYGTLETIMSSSRSSEEEKAKKKKSAAEIADEVRGRAMRKGSDPPAAAPLAEDSKSGSSGGTSGSVAAQPEGPGGRGLARKKSASFATAVMDSTRLQHTTPAGQRKKKKGAATMTTATTTAAAAAAITSSPRGSAATLVSEPALPQTSMGHLEIRTAPDDGSAEPRCPDAVVVGGLLPRPEDLRPSASGGYVPGWSAWIPWRSGGASGPNRRGGVGGGGASHAEGSLRQLLKTVDAKDKGMDKGKAVDREDPVGKSPEGP